MKKISVIMATYKTPREYLDLSIKSILEQTYKNIELIIVCDGDEEEYNYIKTINDKRIILLLNKENKGLPYSLNLGIERASGEYIARMDSDDISVNNRLEKQLEYLEKNKYIDLCATYGQLFGDENGIKALPFIKKEEIKIQLLYRATFIHPTVMAKKEVFKENKYNESFNCSQDFELWSRISLKYNMEVMKFVGLKYRIHKSQISINKAGVQNKNAEKIIYNNTLKLYNYYDEKIYKTLCILGGKDKLTKNNYKDVSINIDYIIEKNINFDKKILKKVLYNRFFELVYKEKIFCFDFISLKKILKTYNLKDMLQRIIYKIQYR